MQVYADIHCKPLFNPLVKHPAVSLKGRSYVTRIKKGKVEVNIIRLHGVFLCTAAFNVKTYVELVLQPFCMLVRVDSVGISYHAE